MGWCNRRSRGSVEWVVCQREGLHFFRVPLVVVMPPRELTAKGDDNLFSAQASVLRERFGYTEKQCWNKARCCYCCLLIWEVRPPLVFPWLTLTWDDCRHWLISLGNVEGHGNKLHHFKTVIIYCYMQSERGKVGLGTGSWCLSPF